MCSYSQEYNKALKLANKSSLVLHRSIKPSPSSKNLYDIKQCAALEYFSLIWDVHLKIIALWSENGYNVFSNLELLICVALGLVLHQICNLHQVCTPASDRL